MVKPMPGMVSTTVLDSQLLRRPTVVQDTSTVVDTVSGTVDTAAEIDVERPTDVMVVKAVLVGDPTQAIPGSRLRLGAR